MVVGVFLGQRPSAGYSVEIIRTVDANGRLRVEYVETRPPAGSVTAQVLTAPFHLVAIPRHADPVSFEPVDK